MEDLMKEFLNYPIIDILLSHIDFLEYNLNNNKMTIHYKGDTTKTIECSIDQYAALDRKLFEVQER